MTRTLHFTSHASNLVLVRTFVRDFLARIGVSEGEAYLIVLALDELSSNIIRHAYSGEAGRPVELTLSHRRGELRCRVRDHGQHVETGDFPVLPPDAHRGGGLGLHFISRAFPVMKRRRRQPGSETLLKRTLNPVSPETPPALSASHPQVQDG